MPEAQILAEQFDDLEQQEETATVGMWTFLATEVLFFGGLFMAYVVYRTTYPHAFAVGSHHDNLLLGSMNTAVLLTSSLTMALGVHAAQEGRRKRLIVFLGITLVFGLAFLALKGLEYSEHVSEGLFPGRNFKAGLPHGTEMFFVLYFLMTGLHAVHMIVGCAVLVVMLCLARKGRFSARYYTPIEITGLYWHIVDIVWVFLYPMFYLIPWR
jgi:cytochrome c oxidase subunit 3